MPEKSITATVLWDKLGISVSAICAIHCLFLPVIISLLPLWSFADILHGWTHPLFILLIVPTAYFAAKRSHYDKSISSFLTAGLVFIIIGWAAGHYWFGFTFESLMTLSGSLLLIAGHWLNYRHHRVCKNAGHNHHPVNKHVD